MESLNSDDDRARFSTVVLPYLGDAYALARWLTGDRADAEDVEKRARSSSLFRLSTLHVHGCDHNGEDRECAGFIPEI